MGGEIPEGCNLDLYSAILHISVRGQSRQALGPILQPEVAEAPLLHGHCPNWQHTWRVTAAVTLCRCCVVMQ